MNQPAPRELCERCEMFRILMIGSNQRILIFKNDDIIRVIHGKEFWFEYLEKTMIQK